MQLYRLFLCHIIKFNSKIDPPSKYKGKRKTYKKWKGKIKGRKYKVKKKKGKEKSVGLHYWDNFSKCVLSKY